MPISQMFLYVQENKVRPFFIKDAKNRRNRLNHSCRKTRFKNITNAQINRLLFVFHCLQDNVCTLFKGYFTKIEHNINTRNNGCSLKLPKTFQSKIRIWTEKFCLSRSSSLQYFTSAFKKFKF